MAHPFEITNEIEVDATPEEVWDAIATGPGVDSWFMGRNEIGPVRAAPRAGAPGLDDGDDRHGVAASNAPRGAEA